MKIGPQPDEFERWLQAYGDAWIDQAPDAVVKLFGLDAAYHDEPFEEPMIGRAAIHRYWTDGAKNGQRDVTFKALPITVCGNEGYAKWSATFRRVPSGQYVEVDGILYAKFNAQMLCIEFREWWHRREWDA